MPKTPAEPELVHGEPFQITPRTGEPHAKAPVHIHVEPLFFLDLSRYGGPIIPIDCPPARVIDRMATLYIHGPQALALPPVNPQPNDEFGKLEVSQEDLEAKPEPPKRGR